MFSFADNKFAIVVIACVVIIASLGALLIWAWATIKSLRLNLVKAHLTIDQLREESNRRKLQYDGKLADRIKEIDNSHRAMTEINSNIKEVLTYISKKIAKPIHSIKNVIQAISRDNFSHNQFFNVLELEVETLEVVLDRILSINVVHSAQPRKERCKVSHLYEKAIHKVKLDQSLDEIKISTWSELDEVYTDKLLIEVILINLISLVAFRLGTLPKGHNKEMFVKLFKLEGSGFSLSVQWPTLLQYKFNNSITPESLDSPINGLDLVHLAVQKLNGLMLNGQAGDSIGEFQIKFRNNK